MEIVAPKAVTVILERLRTEGIFPDLTMRISPDLPLLFTLSGPVPENKPYKEFAIPLSMLMILGAPRGENSMVHCRRERRCAYYSARAAGRGGQERTDRDRPRSQEKFGKVNRASFKRSAETFLRRINRRRYWQRLELIPKEEGKAFEKIYRNPGALFGETEWNRFLKRFRKQGPGVTGRSTYTPVGTKAATGDQRASQSEKTSGEVHRLTYQMTL